MKEIDRKALQEAVSRLNQVLEEIQARCGDTVRIVPRANFNTDTGYAAVVVEVTAAVETFR